MKYILVRKNSLTATLTALYLETCFDLVTVIVIAVVSEYSAAEAPSHIRNNIFWVKVSNSGLCCSKRTDNPVLKICDTGKETKIEQTYFRIWSAGYNSWYHLIALNETYQMVLLLSSNSSKPKGCEGFLFYVTPKKLWKSIVFQLKIWISLT